MKRYLPFAALLLTLAACDNFSTKTYEDDLVMPLREESADSLFFTASVEYVSGGLRVPAADNINTTILSQAFDLEDGLEVGIEETAARYRENLIDEYLNENDTPEAEGILTWEDRINGSFAGRYKGWINYLLTYYSFRGGAHGLQTVSHIVFDKETGAVVTEADLFADGYTAPVSALLQESVIQAMKAEDPELLELLIKEALVPNGNFSVGPDGVEWTFQPYEAGPYALGAITAGASWQDLKPYLK